MQAASIAPATCRFRFIDPMRLEQTIDVERPNLILMDVVMPQRNGFQACRELKGKAEYDASADHGDVQEHRNWQVHGQAAGRRPLRSEAVHQRRAFGTVRGTVGKS